MSFVLDSGGVSALAERSRRSAALIEAIQRQGMWPPTIPSPVLVECLRGSSGPDARTNRLIKACDVVEYMSEEVMRRAAFLRSSAQRGSAVDALVVAMAEPLGSVLTSDVGDLSALAAHARNVHIERV